MSKGAAKSAAGTGQQVGVTWAQAVRDITIAAINRGQLPVLLVGVIVLVLVWKLTPEAADSLLRQIVEHLKDWSLVGYGLFALVSLGWIFTNRRQRSIYEAEINRLSDERTVVQKHVLGDKVKSSGG